jgi:hypothetical protein
MQHLIFRSIVQEHGAVALNNQLLSHKIQSFEQIKKADVAIAANRNVKEEHHNNEIDKNKDNVINDANNNGEHILEEHEERITLRDPIYHPEYGKGSKKLDPKLKYLIVNVIYRGFSNYLLEITRGIAIAKKYGRVALIRKVFTNEHVFRADEYFEGIPSTKDFIKYKGEKNQAIFNNTRIIPTKLSNVYPNKNGIDEATMYTMYQRLNMKNTFDYPDDIGQVEFIEDYLDDLANLTMTSCVFYSSVKLHLYQIPCFQKTKNDFIFAIHNSYHIDRVVHKPPVFKQSFKQMADKYIKEKFGLEVSKFMVLQVRLGDFVTRGWEGPSLLKIAPGIAQLQKQWDMPLVIITNDVNNETLLSVTSDAQYQHWIVTGKTYQMEREQGHFPVVMDIYLAHRSKIFLANRKSSLRILALILNREHPIAFVNEWDLSNKLEWKKFHDQLYKQIHRPPPPSKALPKK